MTPKISAVEALLRRRDFYLRIPRERLTHRSGMDANSASRDARKSDAGYATADPTAALPASETQTVPCNPPTTPPA